jgi:hypothetical protein
MRQSIDRDERLFVLRAHHEGRRDVRWLSVEKLPCLLVRFELF